MDENGEDKMSEALAEQTVRPMPNADGRRLGSNDTLFNLSLLNAVAVAAVFYFAAGFAVGGAFMLGLVFFLIVMPLILCLCYGILWAVQKQRHYVLATNLVLIVTLIGFVALAYLGAGAGDSAH